MGEILFYGFLIGFAMFFGDMAYKIIVASILLIVLLFLLSPLVAGIIYGIAVGIFYWAIITYRR